MRLVGVLILACVPALALTSTGCGGKDSDKKKDTAGTKTEKTNAEKIVGKWELTKSPEKGPVPKMIVEFTQDGKLKGSMEGKEMPAGTYKVEGDKLITSMPGPKGKDMTETATIKTLNDTTLITEETKRGKTETVEFKRK